MKNVGVFETLATEEHPQGGQVIEVVAVFQTTDGAFVRFDRARYAVGFLLPDVQTPVNGHIRLEPRDFAPVAPELVP